MIGRIIGVVILGITGGLCAVLGYLLWKKEKTAILHGYHADKVSPENRKAFCRLSGIGLIAIGAGLLLTGAILAVTDSACGFICFAVCFAAGLGMLTAAGAKYNR